MLNKKTFLILTLLILLVFPSLSFGATVSKKVSKLKITKVVKVAKPQIRILIVPGHDNEFWGAEYGTRKEAEMNRVLASQIYTLLLQDKRFKVFITRNSAGYTKTFQDYFDQNKDAIVKFKTDAKAQMKQSVSSGDFIVKKSVPHMSVNETIAERLYGIDKWVDENKIDAVIHVHFDDEGRMHYSDIGLYKGFTVYYPDTEMPNGTESEKLAKDIFNKLTTKYITSTYPKEAGGFMPDQTLIALGANETLNKDVKSVLIEYGYIYEKLFRKTAVRHQTYKKMADLTVKGIKNYFFPTN